MCINTPSSNGRTPAFGAENRGSSPCGVTITFAIKIKHKLNDEDFLNCVLSSKEKEKLAKRHKRFINNLFYQTIEDMHDYAYGD